MAGMTMSPQLRESPETANFQAAGCWAASGATRANASQSFFIV
jgi:hypothetical protein